MSGQVARFGTVNPSWNSWAAGMERAMRGAVGRLKEHLAEIHDLTCAASLMGWDQQTQMPPGGGLHRAQQTSTLRRLAHEKFTGPETEPLLDAAARETVGRAEEDD